MSDIHAVSSLLVETLAGATAGIVSTLAVHPLDVIKTRLQVNPTSSSQWGTSFRIARDIVRTEGSPAALYRGFTPNAVGNSVSWALYFLWYNKLKDTLAQYHGHYDDAGQTGGRGAGDGRQLSSLDYFAASGTAGVLTVVLTNPIWVIKTRMLSTGRSAPGAYRGMADGVTSILRADGPAGFYRGLLPSLLGVSHGAVQFMAYEQLKNWRARRRRRVEGPDHLALSNGDYLLLSAAAKVFAGSITYPYQVVRARLQTYDAERMYKSATDVVRRVWRNEGLPGFYKGLGPNLIRVLPSTCVTFLVYENTRFYLPSLLAPTS